MRYTCTNLRCDTLTFEGDITDICPGCGHVGRVHSSQPPAPIAVADTASQILQAAGLPIATLGVLADIPGYLAGSMAAKTEEELAETRLRCLVPPHRWETMVAEVDRRAEWFRRLWAELPDPQPMQPNGVMVTPRAAAFRSVCDDVAEALAR